MKKIQNQYFFYIFFAIISIILNNVTQIALQFFFNKSNCKLLQEIIFFNINYGFLLKLFVATIVSFVFKYIVDKIIIFEDKTTNAKKNVIQIIKYTSFAFVTTAIFWATQLLFKLIWQTEFAEIIGACLGLSIGYTLKFIFDKNVVFEQKD